jgi:hypothetical protein
VKRTKSSLFGVSEEPLYYAGTFRTRFFAFVGGHILEEFSRTTWEWS